MIFSYKVMELKMKKKEGNIGKFITFQNTSINPISRFLFY